MGNDTFFDLCKREVVEYFNQHADKTDHKKITEDDVLFGHVKFFRITRLL